MEDQIQPDSFPAITLMEADKPAFFRIMKDLGEPIPRAIPYQAFGIHYTQYMFESHADAVLMLWEERDDGKIL